MAVNLNSKASPPAVFYANPLRMALYVLRHFGVGAMVGFVRLMAFCKYPASLMDRFTPRSVPPTLDELLARAPNERRRQPDRARVHGQRDGSRRPLPAGSRAAPHAARARGLRRGAVHLQGALHAGQRALPRLHLRAERGRRAHAPREGRHGRALGRALPLDRREGRRGAHEDAGAAHPRRGRARDRRRAARRNAHHGARGDLEPRQAGDALRAGRARASRRRDDRARGAHRASRRLRAPALQALAAAEARPALRASQRRPAHALQHDARARSRAPAGELRGVPARRGARAPGRSACRSRP